jgi:hypothetical protein
MYACSRIALQDRCSSQLQTTSETRVASGGLCMSISLAKEQKLQSAYKRFSFHFAPCAHSTHAKRSRKTFQLRLRLHRGRLESHTYMYTYSQVRILWYMHAAHAGTSTARGRRAPPPGAFIPFICASVYARAACARAPDVFASSTGRALCVCEYISITKGAPQHTTRTCSLLRVYTVPGVHCTPGMYTRRAAFCAAAAMAN